MSLYLPDTNTVSALMRRTTNVERRLQEVSDSGGRLLPSPVVEFEIRRGLIRAKATRLTLRFEEVTEEFDYAPLERTVWLRAAHLWAHSRDEAEPIPDADILIAAQALELPAVLVTDNERHFQVFRPLGRVAENRVSSP